LQPDRFPSARRSLAKLGIGTVLVPRAAGVLSALGLAVAERRRDFVGPYRGELDFGPLEKLALAELPGAWLQRLVDARYRGQAFELTVPAEDWLAGFHAAHERRYGFRSDAEPVELVHLRMVATLPGTSPSLEEPEAAGQAATARRRAYLGGEWIEVVVHDRTRMGRGSRVAGPAIVELPEATCLVHDGWDGEIDAVGTLVLRSA